MLKNIFIINNIIKIEIIKKSENYRNLNASNWLVTFSPLNNFQTVMMIKKDVIK
jgi:hypothetical protein